MVSDHGSLEVGDDEWLILEGTRNIFAVSKKDCCFVSTVCAVGFHLWGLCKMKNYFWGENCE